MMFFFFDLPMLPSVVWLYLILWLNEQDSMNSVLVCNPSGKMIPALA